MLDFSDQRLLAFSLNVVASVVVLTSFALIASAFFKRHPATRHFILLVALQARRGSPLHQSAVNLLKSAGFKKIRLVVATSNGEVAIEY